MTEVGAAVHEGAGRQLAAVTAIETRARALLAETRKVVVSLAADAAPGAAGPGTTPGAGPEAHQPGTGLAMTAHQTAAARP